MTISIEELGPGEAKGSLRIAVVAGDRRVEGVLGFLMSYPQTPEFIADEKLTTAETQAIDAWLKQRFSRGEFGPTESRLTRPQ